MRLLNKIKTFAFITLLAAFAQPSIAQDLLARQAPVDRKMKAVDTLLLHNCLLYTSDAADDLLTV